MKIYNICGYVMYKEEDVKAFFGDSFNMTFRGCTITEFEGEWYIPKYDVDCFFNKDLEWD
jgi:hypothetical protein